MNCPKCGGGNIDGANFCQYCAARMDGTSVQGNQRTQWKNNGKKPINQRVWFWVVNAFFIIAILISITSGNIFASLMFLSFAGLFTSASTLMVHSFVKKVRLIAPIVMAASCVLFFTSIAIAPVREKPSEIISTTVHTSTYASTSTPLSSKTSATATAQPTPDEEDGVLGDLKVTIKDAKLSKDYSGENSVVITYEWSHTKDSSVSFMAAVSDKVFQNGIECQRGILVEGADSSDMLKEIKANVTQTVKLGYVLNDRISDLEVEVYRWLSFNKEKVTKTFQFPLKKL